VRRFREGSGNAAMVARELPPDEVLASWQHVDQRALDLRAAGVPGALRELRVRAYLDLLQERDSRAALDDPGQNSTPGGNAAPGRNAGPGGNAGADGNADPDEPGGPRGCGPGDDPGGSGGTGPSARSRPVCPDAGLAVAALVNITVPWSTAVGRSDAPGEAGGFGLLDAQDTRDLVTAAGRHPGTRWCLTVLHSDGTAAAHGCARGQPPPPGTGQPTATPGPDPPPDTSPRDLAGRMRIQITPIARGGCGHDQAEPGYRPSRKLQHLIKVRNARCTARGCGQPAARCDLDHTIAWDQGGLTCECDLAPLCRHHHRCKQAEGWQLEQSEPCVLVWRTPAGRTYATGPTVYEA
jgi:hypothetical protein